jgi:biotin carboxylase
MTQKKLLILGGDHFTIPVVKAAHACGCYVITADYLPDNVAHKYSDEYVNLSTTDKEGILAFAREAKVDGIVTFTDSGVVSAAYACHHLSLPMPGSLESIELLQNKDKFRQFLTDNGFNVPRAQGFTSLEEVKQCDWVQEALSTPNQPLIVKPTDSAGSKGVTKIEHVNELPKAVEFALQYSLCGRIIIEDFIEKSGHSSDSDCFSIDGKLAYASYSMQWFDETAVGPYAPSAYSWPSDMGKNNEDYLTKEINRLLGLLHMGTTVYNVETRVGQDGKPYIMEISPRGGGNRLSEMVRYATGIDMLENACRAAVGMPLTMKADQSSQVTYNGHWGEIILHAQKEGTLKGIKILPDMKPYVIEEDLWKQVGDHVSAFASARDAIGTIVLRCDSHQSLVNAILHQQEWLTIEVD